MSGQREGFDPAKAWRDALYLAATAYDLPPEALEMSGEIPVFEPISPTLQLSPPFGLTRRGTIRYVKDEGTWKLALHMYAEDGRLSLAEARLLSEVEEGVVHDLFEELRAGNIFVVNVPSAHVLTACITQPDGNTICFDLTGLNARPEVSNIPSVVQEINQTWRIKADYSDIFRAVELAAYVDDSPETPPQP